MEQVHVSTKHSDRADVLTIAHSTSKTLPLYLTFAMRVIGSSPHIGRRSKWLLRRAMRRQMATGVLSSDGELRAVIVLYDLLFLQRVEGGTFAVEEEMRMQGLGKILACISVLMAYFMRRKMIARVHVENHPMLELLRKAGWVKRRGLVGFLLRPLDLIARETTLEPGDWDTLVANSARYLEEVRAQAGFDFQHKIFVSEHLWRRVVLLAHGRFAV